MDNKQKILDRIAKMLRLANDAGASDGERDNALRMAHATLAKYNLDLSQVDLEGPNGNGGVQEERTVEKRTFYGRTPWARSVCLSVAEMLFCKYIYTVSRYDHTNVVHCFVGRQSNAVTASLLAEYLVKSIRKEGKVRAREHGGGSAWQRSFCYGASERIRTRVHELVADSGQMKAEPTRPTVSGALVLASVYASEAQQNEMAMTKFFSKLRTAATRPITLESSEGRRQGQEYGSRVSLSRQLS